LNSQLDVFQNKDTVEACRKLVVLLREPDVSSYSSSESTLSESQLGEVFFDTTATSGSLSKELGGILCSAVKIIQTYTRERIHLHEQLKSKELELECAHEQRQFESE